MKELDDLNPPRFISLVWDDDDGWILTSNCDGQEEVAAGLSEWLFHFATGMATFEPYDA